MRYEQHVRSLPKVFESEIETGKEWDHKVVEGWEIVDPMGSSFILNGSRVDHILVHFQGCRLEESQEMILVRERGKNKLVHTKADIIRHLADKRIVSESGGYNDHVLLTSEEKDAILWAAALLDDTNRNLVIGKREKE